MSQPADGSPFLATLLAGMWVFVVDEAQRAGAIGTRLGVPKVLNIVLSGVEVVDHGR